uniref:Mitochondrial import inner membrane translocase subunit n=1 Tax=Hemiselmis andersenii TaxID=464988 RepID=A0A7S1DFI8_HEMAN
MPAGEQQKLMVMLEEMQLKEQVTMYNSLVERCFANCTSTFRSKNLDEREEKCIVRCTQKFIKASARAGQTFQTMGVPMMGGQAAGAGAGAPTPGK